MYEDLDMNFSVIWIWFVDLRDLISMKGGFVDLLDVFDYQEEGVLIFMNIP